MWEPGLPDGDRLAYNASKAMFEDVRLLQAGFWGLSMCSSSNRCKVDTGIFRAAATRARPVGNRLRWQVWIKAAAEVIKPRPMAPGPGPVLTTCWPLRLCEWPRPDCSGPRLLALLDTVAKAPADGRG